MIVGALGFRNEYDGHTIEKALAQTTSLTGTAPQTATVDRGYRGKAMVGETIIQIPKPFNPKTTTLYQQKTLKKSFGRRAAIEPTISHLKSGYRLGRNYYSGIFGDNINIILSAAAFNFKRMMNKWKAAFLAYLQRLIFIFQQLLSNLIPLKLKGQPGF